MFTVQMVTSGHISANTSTQTYSILCSESYIYFLLIQMLNSYFDHVRVYLVGLLPSSQGLLTYMWWLLCTVAWSHPPSDSMVEAALYAFYISRFGIPSVITTEMCPVWIYSLPKPHEFIVCQHTRVTGLIKHFHQQLIMKATLKAMPDLNKGEVFTTGATGD